MERIGVGMEGGFHVRPKIKFTYKKQNREKCGISNIRVIRGRI